jgi:hypothetical protein
MGKTGRLKAKDFRKPCYKYPKKLPKGRFQFNSHPGTTDGRGFSEKPGFSSHLSLQWT